MDLKEITELVKLVGKSNLIELKIKNGDFEISLKTDKHGLTRPGEPERSYVSSTVVPAVTTSPASTSPVKPAEAIDKAPEIIQEETSSATSYLEIRSPMVGTFYRSSSPDKPPYAKVGDMIQKGSVVCIIEAMKLFNEIESEIAGKIARVMVEDATPVEYDQVLFLIEK